LQSSTYPADEWNQLSRRLRRFLDYAAKAIEIEDIAVRVTELERASRETKFDPTGQA
jgi:hypothetical protein